MPLPKEKERFTYQDYVTWPDDERWELIDGQAYNMSPGPIVKHQEIAGNFYHFLRLALNKKKCIPYIPQIDVVLSEYDVVQPDVLVVCDPEKITKKNIQGAPDLVIEVLSPSTARKDRWEKKKLYEKHGVREYILADPDGQYIERFKLGDDGLFDRGEIFDPQAELTFTSLENVTIPLWEIFGVEKQES